MGISIYQEARGLGYSKYEAATIQAGAILTAASPAVATFISHQFHKDNSLTGLLMGLALASSPVAYIAGVHFTKKAVDVFRKEKVSKIES